MKTTTSLFALSLAVLLTACGGSYHEVAPAPPAAREVPASATASVVAYTRFAASLPASDTEDPLGVNNVVPPTSETEQPQAL